MSATVVCPVCQGSGDWVEYDADDYDVWVNCNACSGSGRIEIDLDTLEVSEEEKV